MLLHRFRADLLPIAIKRYSIFPQRSRTRAFPSDFLESHQDTRWFVESLTPSRCILQHQPTPLNEIVTHEVIKRRGGEVLVQNRTPMHIYGNIQNKKNIYLHPTLKVSTIDCILFMNCYGLENYVCYKFKSQPFFFLLPQISLPNWRSHNLL